LVSSDRLISCRPSNSWPLAKNPNLTILPIPYADEGQTVDLVNHTALEVDAWLFTGVIPYTIARSAEVLDRPAVYISYTGATLYRVLVELLNRGVDTSSISFDTLEIDQVTEVLRDADLSSESSVRQTVSQVTRSRPTSLSSTDGQQLRRAPPSRSHVSGPSTPRFTTRVETIRLSPALASVRSALRTVSLAAAQRIGSDAQVVMGFIDLPEPDPLLSDDVASLAASLFPSTVVGTSS
jgi:hypothetical protein